MWFGGDCDGRFRVRGGGGGGRGGGEMNRRGGSASWDERGARLQQLSRKDEDLALFQDMRIREQQSLDPSPDHAHGSSKFRGVPNARTRGSNDLLTSETDKNDYDWLLTPPGTPLFPSLDRDWLVPSPTGQRDSSRWPSKLSRVSNDAQALVSSSSSASSGGSSARLFSANATSTRGNPSPRRQSAPPPVSYSTGMNTRQPVHSKPGVTSTSNGVRPSTPTRRPSSAPSLSASTAPRRPSTPTLGTTTTTTTPSTTARSTGSRPSTPTPTRPSPASSRASTPTRRSSLTPTSGTTPMSNGRTSRGTSPVRRPQPQVASAPHERSSSNSRASTVSRSPGMDTASLPSHLNKSYNNHVDRDISSFTRRAASSANEAPKSDPVRKPAAKTCTGNSRETSFFGTSISKKSLDTAIRHMDIRRSTPSGFRAPPATTTYPKSSTVIARSQIQQQQQRPDYSRLLSSEQRHDRSLALFEHEVKDKPSLFPVQDPGDDSFLLEFSSLTSSAEATFLEEADYLKDP